VRIEEHGGVPCARVAGEIDTSNAERVLEDVLRGVSTTGPGLVLDLTDTRYIDSSGVHALFDATKHLAAMQQELRIVVPSDSLIVEVLRVTGLVDLVAVDDRIEDAVRALHGRAPDAGQ
jgi:anti-anti-sigma factor